MDSASFFLKQSVFTEPEPYAGLYAELPGTVPEICEVVSGLCLDYRDIYKYPIVNERLLDLNLRYVSDSIKALLSLDKRPLSEARAPENRLTAASGDFVNLFVSIARAKGIPARRRLGFIDAPTGMWEAYSVAEYFANGVWLQADPAAYPHTSFVPAAEVWQSCRLGTAHASAYRDDSCSGLEAVRAAVMLDLACMQGFELLGWDRYGWMLRPFADFSERAWEIMDNAAALLIAGDIEKLRAAYEGEEGLQVSKGVLCDSPSTPAFKDALKK